MGTLTADTRAAVRDLTRAGWGEERIAALLGISPRTVRRYRADAAHRAARIRARSRALAALLDRDA